jgi:hypothetical protein
MKVVAILAVRNERNYIETCLAHLEKQGLHFCVIDNGSTDDTVAIANRFWGRGLMRIVNVPYRGFYDWVSLLEAKSQLSTELGAHWYIHQDADEILESNVPRESLAQAIERVDREGFNAINFDEFTFIPTSEHDHYEGNDYVANMKHYYFFEPCKTRLVRAWRAAGRVDLASSGGHFASTEDSRIYPQNFVLRHYIGLSMTYLRQKYSGRKFSPAEVSERGWHGWRAEFDRWNVRPPELSELNNVDHGWDTTAPKLEHQFIVRV